MKAFLALHESGITADHLPGAPGITTTPITLLFPTPNFLRILWPNTTSGQYNETNRHQTFFKLLSKTETVFQIFPTVSQNTAEPQCIATKIH